MGSEPNEQRFSLMNLIKTSLRNRLGKEHLTTCMRVASDRRCPAQGGSAAAASQTHARPSQAWLGSMSCTRGAQGKSKSASQTLERKKYPDWTCKNGRGPAAAAGVPRPLDRAQLLGQLPLAALAAARSSSLNEPSWHARHAAPHAAQRPLAPLARCPLAQPGCDVLAIPHISPDMVRTSGALAGRTLGRGVVGGREATKPGQSLAVGARWMAVDARVEDRGRPGAFTSRRVKRRCLAPWRSVPSRPSGHPAPPAPG